MNMIQPILSRRKPVGRMGVPMIRQLLRKRKLNKRALHRYTLMLAIKIVINAFSIQACAQTSANQGWAVLETGLGQKNAGQRLGAVRVLGMIPADPHAADLAEKALKDKSSVVRAAAATSLGKMHATAAAASLKAALDDKNVSVVMAAAHALRLLNDPTCYDVYYEVFTGERKNNTGMIAQEMQVLHDPKQLVQMGFSEGIGYIPFAGIGWQAFHTIMQDKKSGAAAKAALISALAMDPEGRTGKLLLKVSKNPNWVLRVAALEAIDKRGDPKLIEGIEPRLSDSKREVRFAAAATVVHLRDVAQIQVAGDANGGQTIPVNASSGDFTVSVPRIVYPR